MAFIFLKEGQSYRQTLLCESHVSSKPFRGIHGTLRHSLGPRKIFDLLGAKLNTINTAERLSLVTVRRLGVKLVPLPSKTPWASYGWECAQVNGNRVASQSQHEGPSSERRASLQVVLGHRTLRKVSLSASMPSTGRLVMQTSQGHVPACYRKGSCTRQPVNGLLQRQGILEEF